MKYTRAVTALLSLVIAFWGLSAAALAADKTESDDFTTITPQSYIADTPLRVGTVIQADSKDPTKVLPATQDKLSSAFGVIVDGSYSPITISSSAANQVYVATSGRHAALVSNENGSISAGDFLVVSSLSGTLMKASVKQDIVFAKALSSFDGKNNAIGTTTLKDVKGKDLKKIGIGSVSVSIEIIANPEKKSTEANLPPQLQRIGQAIAEKPVDPIRIYISMAIVTLSIIVAIALLISGVRSSIIAIGRNPLSKKSILKGLFQVILTSVLVLIIGLFTVYLLLRL